MYQHEEYNLGQIRTGYMVFDDIMNLYTTVIEVIVYCCYMSTSTLNFYCDVISGQPTKCDMQYAKCDMQYTKCDMRNLHEQNYFSSNFYPLN